LTSHDTKHNLKIFFIPPFVLAQYKFDVRKVVKSN